MIEKYHRHFNCCPPIRLFFLVASFCLLATGCASPTLQPTAENGQLDLSMWDFSSNRPIALNGQWEFYWGKLLTPDDLETLSPSGFITVPGLWKDAVVSGAPLPSKGFGTYRLRVKIAPSDDPKLLMVHRALCVWNVWIDGKQASTSGSVGETEVAEIPKRHITLSRIVSHQSEVDILIQVSNFYNIQGGIKAPILLGEEQQFQQNISKKRIFIAGLSGMLLVLAFYHLVLFASRRSEKTNLYFGLYCLLWAVRTVFDGNGVYLASHVFPTLPWRLTIDLSLLPNGVSIPLLVMFYHSLFPFKYRKRVERFYQLCGGAFVLVMVALPPNAYGLIPLLYMPIALSVFPYLLGRFVVDFYKKSPGTRLLAPAYIVLALCELNDVLYDFDLISTAELGSLGGLVFVLVYSILISKRFVDAFYVVEKLSVALEEKTVRLARANEIKDQFLANTSHELRTPLTGIVGISESMIEGVAGELTDTARDNLALIVSSGKRLAALVDDILDFSRLKHRDIRLELKPLDVEPIVAMTMVILKPLAEKKGLVLKNEIPFSLPRVLADENRMLQIFYNLVGNGIKFTDRGSVSVTGNVIGDKVEVCVTDTGIGISKDDQSHIFDSFEQADNADVRSQKGCGLGLSITKHLVELHHGDIKVESESQMGSTFRFTLPMTHRSAVEEADLRLSSVIDRFEDTTSTELGLESLDRQSDLPLTDAVEQCKVLVVDDDPVNLRVVKNIFGLEKIYVKTAINGTHALVIIEQGYDPDIVLLDIMMPNMSGYEVCRELRQKWSPSQLPVIMFTAKNSVHDLAQAYEAGANDYIVKPFSRQELVSRINLHWELQRTYKQLIDQMILEKEIEKRRLAEQVALIRVHRERCAKFRYQFSPHFLFNTLNSIRSAVLEDGNTAREMITMLAQLARLSIERRSLDVVTLEEECQMIRLYLALERERYGDYLQTEIEIDPASKDIEVPCFILQPLVENAMKYGKLTSAESLELVIGCKKSEERIEIVVSNTGKWVPVETQVTPVSTGFGMSHLRERLSAHYGDDFSFKNIEQNGWVRVELIIPCTRKMH